MQNNLVKLPYSTQKLKPCTVCCISKLGSKCLSAQYSCKKRLKNPGVGKAKRVIKITKKPPQFQVVSVRAFDDDSGDNGRITYRIKSGDRKGQFQIDEQRGIVSVAPAANPGDKPNTHLDREMISSYVLEIEASDHGVPVKSSTVLVNVDITGKTLTTKNSE